MTPELVNKKKKAAVDAVQNLVADPDLTDAELLDALEAVQSEVTVAVAVLQARLVP